MRVTVNPNLSPRKLVAVVGSQGCGLFVSSMATETGTVTYISPRGAAPSGEKSLEAALLNAKRTPIYEGDSITIQF